MLLLERMQKAVTVIIALRSIVEYGQDGAFEVKECRDDGDGTEKRDIGVMSLVWMLVSGSPALRNDIWQD